MSPPYEGNSPAYEDAETFPRARSDGGGGGGSAGATPRPALTSGQIKLSIPAGVTARPNSGQQIVRWMAEDINVAPLLVQLDVRGTGLPTSIDPFAGQTVVPAGGDGSGDTSVLLGVARLTYGAGNALRVIDMDLRTGSFQLPPSTTCTVEAFLYGTGAATVTVSASIVPGRSDLPTRSFNTQRLSLSAGVNKTVTLPFAARWVGMSGGDPTGIGSGQPTLTLKQGAAGPLIIQDFAAGSFLGAPGQMIELIDRSAITVKSVGAAVVTVRFGLEL